MLFFGNLISKLKGQKKSLSAPNKYTCQYCEVEKPLSKDFFQEVRRFKYGYSTVCLDCSKPKPRNEEKK